MCLLQRYRFWFEHKIKQSEHFQEGLFVCLITAVSNGELIRFHV